MVVHAFDVDVRAADDAGGTVGVADDLELAAEPIKVGLKEIVEVGLAVLVLDTHTYLLVGLQPHHLAVHELHELCDHV